MAELLSHSAFPLPPAADGAGRAGVRALLWLLPALVIGAGIGVLAGLDRWLSPHHPLWGAVPAFLPHAVWWWTPTALALLVLIVATVRGAEWAFDRRYELAAIGLLASTTLTGINIAARDPFELALILSLAIWLVTTLGENRPVRTPRVALFLLAGLSVCTLASIVNGRVVSLLGVHTYLVKFAAAFILIELILTRALHTKALRALIVISVFSASVALFSEVLFATTGFQLSLDDEPTSRIKDTPLGPLLRATALLPTAQSLGHLLTMGLGLVLCRPGGLVVRLLLGGLLFAGAAATLSTGSLVSAGAVLALWPFVQWPGLALHFLAVLTSLGIVAYLTGVLGKLWEALVVIGSWGLSERVELIKRGLHIVEQYPLCGIGARNALRVLHLPVHNSYVQIASETGSIAGLLFITLTCYAVFCCVAAALRAGAPAQRAWLTGLALGMFGIAVHFLSEPLANDYLTYAFFGLAISALVVYRPSGGAQGVAV